MAAKVTPGRRTGVPSAARRGATRRLAAFCVAAWGLGGCSAPVPRVLPMAGHTRGDWLAPLRGDTVALLGEVHDHAALHRLRLEGLQSAIASGWRPALVMEQFDVDRQVDLDRARRERPLDAGHWVAQAGDARAWDWAFYLPIVELALRHQLPLLAGNLSRTQARQLVRADWPVVFDGAQRQALGLDGPAPVRLQAAQERSVQAGHCGLLPPSLLPGMARAQLARDAVMAGVVRTQVQREPGRGAVLIAGNGHVRRDQGVPQWLQDIPPGRLWVVGFVEEGEPAALALHDAEVRAAPIDRPDPCADLDRQFAAPVPGKTPAD